MAAALKVGENMDDWNCNQRPAAATSTVALGCSVRASRQPRPAASHAHCELESTDLDRHVEVLSWPAIQPSAMPARAFLGQPWPALPCLICLQVFKVHGYTGGGARAHRKVVLVCNFLSPSNQLRCPERQLLC